MKKQGMVCLLLFLCSPLFGSAASRLPDTPAPETWRETITEELAALDLIIDAPFAVDDRFTEPGIRLFTTAGEGRLSLHQRLQDQDTPLHYCIGSSEDVHTADPAAAWALLSRAIPAFVHATTPDATEQDAQILRDALRKLIDEQAALESGAQPIDAIYDLRNTHYYLYSGNAEFAPRLGVEYFDPITPDLPAAS